MTIGTVAGSIVYPVMGECLQSFGSYTKETIKKAVMLLYQWGQDKGFNYDLELCGDLLRSLCQAGVKAGRRQANKELKDRGLQPKRGRPKKRGSKNKQPRKRKEEAPLSAGESDVDEPTVNTSGKKIFLTKSPAWLPKPPVASWLPGLPEPPSAAPRLPRLISFA